MATVITQIANDTYKGFETQASAITVQQRQSEKTREGIQKTYEELQELKAQVQSSAETVTNEAAANHAKLQDIVQHINDVPGKIKELQDMMNKVDAQITEVKS